MNSEEFKELQLDTLKRDYERRVSMIGEEAKEVSTTERVSVRISTNQFGVKTAWVTGEDGKEHGCTPGGHQQETAHWIIQRLLDSAREIH